VARLDEGHAYERIERLRKILKLDPKAIDEAATLKRWAGQSYSDDMCEYAEALARLSDFSLLPVIRERALDPIRLPANNAIWYLTRHGTAGDYRVLRETMLNEIKKGGNRGNGNSPFGSIAGGACESKNPLAVPLLVDLLSERDGDYSLAERSFVALSVLTGHEAGYVRDGSREERNAAIDRWMGWWNLEGREQFLLKFPQVRDVIAERKLQFNPDKIDALAALVSVSDGDEQSPVIFDIPRRLLLNLLDTGRIAASEDGRGRPVFRFTSPNAGLEWFNSAEPVDADDGTGKKLIPSMRVKTRGLTRPDSTGRVWCRWDRALSPIAVFDGKSWRSFAEPLPPGRIDNPIQFISVFQGAAGTMVFTDSNHHFHLFDDAGHVHAESASDLFLRHPERLQRALPQPSKTSNAFYSHLVKDDLGRVWWSNWETDWGVLDGATVIKAGDGIPTVSVKRGYRHDLLFPATNGQVFVFRARAANESHGVIAELQEGKVSLVRDLPALHLDNRQNALLALRDRKGRVWVPTSQGSKALDPSGNVVAEHAGRILLEDRDGGLWFQIGSNPASTSLGRLSDENQDSTLALPRLPPFAPLAESPDGTFWAIGGTELVQIHCRDNQIAAGDRFSVPQSNFIWCDNQGRVWLTKRGPGDDQAIRLAVAKPILNGNEK